MDSRTADQIYADMYRIVQHARFDYEDAVYLTHEQIEDIREADQNVTRPERYWTTQVWGQPFCPLVGIPIKVVDKVEDSTPWKRGWRPWPNLAS